MSPLEQYRELEQQLARARQQEDEILDAMESLWGELEKDEREMLRKEGPILRTKKPEGR